MNSGCVYSLTFLSISHFHRYQIIVTKNREASISANPLSEDHGLSGGTSTDPLDANTSELLDELDVFSGVLGQSFVGVDVRAVGLPARQGLVDGLDLGESVDGAGERGDLLAVDLVTDGNLDLVKVVEDVQLGQVEGGVVVDGGRVLEENKIEPSAATAATSGDTDLAADSLELLADLVDLLSGEGTTTNSGLVCLDDTDDLLQLEGREG
jgi:hypothetical protein